jgi:hypothetical protein
MLVAAQFQWAGGACHSSTIQIAAGLLPTGKISLNWRNTLADGRRGFSQGNDGVHFGQAVRRCGLSSRTDNSA